MRRLSRRKKRAIGLAIIGSVGVAGLIASVIMHSDNIDKITEEKGEPPTIVESYKKSPLATFGMLASSIMLIVGYIFLGKELAYNDIETRFGIDTICCKKE